ncbi:MAG: ABC transporter ATP-binding protein [Thermomicrobiales bacterium]|nr:ABC transporter ATP-binding protein [Thermomicrobiales bacterium]
MLQDSIVRSEANATDRGEPIIRLDHIRRDFDTRGGHITAVDDVSFDLFPGDILCLVGESGSGKTTVARMAAGMLKPTRGHVFFEGKDIYEMNKEEFGNYRRAVQIVHQDPYASLNPIHTIGDMLRAPLLKHKICKSRAEATKRAGELLEMVDCRPVENFIDKYPHQLSGGQRQRISIARAMTLNPRVIIADESVSMVDVSIRVSLLNTMLKLRNELGVTFLFITHDLAVVKYFAWEGNIGVMYVGKVIEYGRTPGIIGRGFHPYTRALAAAIPEADPDLTRSKEKLQLRSLDIPKLTELPDGCVFHPRCPYWIQGLCDTTKPPLMRMPDGRLVACHAVQQAVERGDDPRDLAVTDQLANQIMRE